MSDTDAVIAVRAAVAALNDGDIDGYLQGFSPSCLRWVSGLDVPRTLDDMRADIDELYGAIDRCTSARTSCSVRIGSCARGGAWWV